MGPAPDDKIAIFATDDNSPTFYRMVLPASELLKRGFRVSFVPSLGRSSLRGFRVLLVKGAFDENSLAALSRLKGKVRLVLDLDDNYHRIDPRNPAYGHYAGDDEKTSRVAKVISLVDEVIVSTEPLREFYLPYNSSIRVIPNMACPEVFRSEGKARLDQEAICVGWYGSPTHSQDLQELSEVFPAVHRMHPKCRFIFFGDRPPYEVRNAEFIDPVPYSRFPWAMARLNIDIGIAPLADTEFNRCKSNIKWLEMAALRVPLVASAVVPYAASITSGIDGFLCANPAEWIETLGRLISNASLRASIAKRAFYAATSRYGPDRVGSQYAELAAAWLSI